MTGIISHPDVPLPLAVLVEAARRNDLPRMHDHIDFGVSNLAAMVHSLWKVDTQDREAVALDGLAEVDVANVHLDVARSELAELARLLVQAVSIRRANQIIVEQVLAGLRVPNLPPGLTSNTMQRLAILVTRTRTISDIYEVVIPNANALLLALIADNERVAPLRIYMQDKDSMVHW